MVSGKESFADPELDAQVSHLICQSSKAYGQLIIASVPKGYESIPQTASHANSRAWE